jgi:hypothetical protein
MDAEPGQPSGDSQVSQDKSPRANADERVPVHVVELPELGQADLILPLKGALL